MASHTACGFHTRRWAAAFEACCEEVLGTRPRTFVAPLAPDVDNLTEVAASPECAAAGGMVVEAASCDPDPCAPVTPPSGDTVACCLTHEDETECEVITTEACTARSGAATVGTTCEPDPCMSTSPGGDDGGGDDGDDQGENQGGDGGGQDGGGGQD
jgi:hypothetical protein